LTALTAEIQDEGHYDYGHAASRVWDSATFADHARFTQCVFTDVTVSGGVWSRTAFSDIRFEDSRLLAPDLSASHWRDAEFRRGPPTWGSRSPTSPTPAEWARRPGRRGPGGGERAMMGGHASPSGEGAPIMARKAPQHDPGDENLRVGHAKDWAAGIPAVTVA